MYQCLVVLTLRGLCLCSGPRQLLRIGHLSVSEFRHTRVRGARLERLTDLYPVLQQRNNQ